MSKHAAAPQTTGDERASSPGQEGAGRRRAAVPVDAPVPIPVSQRVGTTPAQRPERVAGKRRTPKASTAGRDRSQHARISRTDEQIRRRRRTVSVVLSMALLAVVVVTAALGLTHRQREELATALPQPPAGWRNTTDYEAVAIQQIGWAAGLVNDANPVTNALMVAATSGKVPGLSATCQQHTHGVWLPWLRSEKAAVCSTSAVQAIAALSAAPVYAYVLLGAADICDEPHRTPDWSVLSAYLTTSGADPDVVKADLPALTGQIRSVLASSDHQPCVSGGNRATLATALGIPDSSGADGSN